MLSGTVVRKKSFSVETPLFDAVGCVCVCEDRLLLLRRAEDRSYPGVWGLPSGKVEPKETRVRAVSREVYEETGLLRSAANLDHLEDFHVKNQEFIFLYAVFVTRFTDFPNVRIDPSEHVEYRWFSMNEVQELPMVPGTMECLEAVRYRLFPAKQLSLFPVDDNVLSDALHAEQGRIEGELAPYFFSPFTQHDHSPIVIIGPPAAGKTTAILSLIQERGDLVHHHYDVMKDETSRQYMYLTRFLSGDKSFAFLCQMEALASRYWHGLSVLSDNAVADEWVYSTLAYAKALRYQRSLQDYEFQTFYMAYLAYLQWLPLPRLVIHLTADPGVLRHRVEERGRKLERTSHDFHYLQMLVHSFEEVADEVQTTVPVVRVDTSALDTASVTDALLGFIDGHPPKSS